MTPEQEKIRANQAQQVLDNPMFQEAFTALRADLFEKFQRTKWLQGKERTEIWRTLKNLNNIEQHLSRTMTTGKMHK